MKRILSYILVLLLLLTSISGCSRVVDEDVDNGDEIVSGDDKTLKIAYSLSDPLNPFECKTDFNRHIMTLVYDGLYKNDKKYCPQPDIALSSIVSGCSVNVTIGDSSFSDGTKVSVSDIVYSFNLAKESYSHKEKLSNFLSVSVSSANMLMFTLETPDPYAVSCLDFPIIKSGTNDFENHEFCIGSGRYEFKKYDDNVYLVANVNKKGFNPKIKTIMLEAIHESDSVENSLVIGNTGFYFNDLSSSEYNRLNVQTQEVGINNLVYIGINNYSNIFSDAKLRQAAYYAINRDDIATSVFHSHARNAYLPFNPDWYALENDSFSYTFDKTKAQNLVDEAETPVTYRSITLLYCNETESRIQLAEMIKDNLEDAGFSVDLVPYSKDAYIYDVQAGAFDLYIGEIKLESNMSLNPFFGGSVKYGINQESTVAQKYTSFKNGDCQLIDFNNSFIDEMPFIPICYRNGLACYTNSLDISFEACDSDLFNDIETWSLK